MSLYFYFQIAVYNIFLFLHSTLIACFNETCPNDSLAFRVAEVLLLLIHCL